MIHQLTHASLTGTRLAFSLNELKAFFCAACCAPSPAPALHIEKQVAVCQSEVACSKMPVRRCTHAGADISEAFFSLLRLGVPPSRTSLMPLGCANPVLGQHRKMRSDQIRCHIPGFGAVVRLQSQRPCLQCSTYQTQASWCCAEVGPSTHAGISTACNYGMLAAGG